MGSSRQIVLVRLLDGEEEGSNTILNSVPLGSAREVKEQLSRFNIAPDGSPESAGILYGPGLLIQMPMVGPDDPVNQVMVSIEEEIGWPVIQRACKQLQWKMMDPATGRMFG